MGQFKIEIVGTGGHGVERHKEKGDTINFLAEGDWTPDAIAREALLYVKRKFLERGIVLESAKLIHWPGTLGQVVDDLISGIRESGSFNFAPVSQTTDPSEETIVFPPPPPPTLLEGELPGPEAENQGFEENSEIFGGQ